MKISYFKLELYPIDIARQRGIDEKMLRVVIRVDGKCYDYNQRIPSDDLVSFYDEIFEIAKIKLKEIIDKEKP